MIPTTYDGRDIAGRLSARLDRSVLTNVVGLGEPTTGALVSEHAIFGGSEILKARFTGAPPAIFVVRAKSFAAEESGGGAARGGGARGPRHRVPPTPRPSPNATSRNAPGPSWTRPRSWCRAGGAWARPAATS